MESTLILRLSRQKRAFNCLCQNFVESKNLLIPKKTLSILIIFELLLLTNKKEKILVHAKFYALFTSAHFNIYLLQSFEVKIL